MQSQKVVLQLSTFASNLVEVTNVLQSLSGSSGGSNHDSIFDTLSQMNGAKSSLLDTLVLLNSIFVAEYITNKVPVIYRVHWFLLHAYSKGLSVGTL